MSTSEKQSDSQQSIADTLSFLAEQFVAVAGKEKGNQPLPPKKKDKKDKEEASSDDDDEDYDEEDEDYSEEEEEEDDEDYDDEAGDDIARALCKIIKQHSHLLADCPYLAKHFAKKTE